MLDLESLIRRQESMVRRGGDEPHPSHGRKFLELTTGPDGRYLVSYDRSELGLLSVRQREVRNRERNRLHGRLSRARAVRRVDELRSIYFAKVFWETTSELVSLHDIDNDGSLKLWSRSFAWRLGWSDGVGPGSLRSMCHPSDYIPCRRAFDLTSSGGVCQPLSFRILTRGGDSIMVDVSFGLSEDGVVAIMVAK